MRRAQVFPTAQEGVDTHLPFAECAWMKDALLSDALPVMSQVDLNGRACGLLLPDVDDDLHGALSASVDDR